jgi:hypothetical protein
MYRQWCLLVENLGNNLPANGFLPLLPEISVA